MSKFSWAVSAPLARRMANADNKSRHLDDLADKQIEKQQNFVYFFITANTGVIIYTTNFFIEKTDVKALTSSIVFWPLLLGCISLLVSTVFCVIFLFLNNRAYSLYLDYLREVIEKKTNKKFSNPYKNTIFKITWAMFISFGLGMFLNVAVYVYHFYQVHKKKIEPPKKSATYKAYHDYFFDRGNKWTIGLH